MLVFVHFNRNIYICIRQEKNTAVTFWVMIVGCCIALDCLKVEKWPQKPFDKVKVTSCPVFV